MILNWKRKEWVQKRKQDGSAPKKGPAPPKGLDNKKTLQRGKNVSRPQRSSATKGSDNRGPVL